MQWSQVNPDDSAWRIAPGQKGTSQNVTLSLEVVVILAVRKESAGKGAVFFSPGAGESEHIEESKKGVVRVMEMGGGRPTFTPQE